MHELCYNSERENKKRNKSAKKMQELCHRSSGKGKTMHEDTLYRNLEGSRKNKLINKFIKPSYKPAKTLRS